MCTTICNNFVQQPVSSPPLPQPQQQQQQPVICLDSPTTATTIQPTVINQIPVFTPLSTITTSPSIINIPQTQLQRTASVVMPQAQPLQIIQQPQAVQVVQNPPPAQTVQIAPTAAQIIQTPPVLQTIQSRFVSLKFNNYLKKKNLN